MGLPARPRPPPSGGLFPACGDGSTERSKAKRGKQFVPRIRGWVAIGQVPAYPVCIRSLRAGMGRGEARGRTQGLRSFPACGDGAPLDQDVNLLPLLFPACGDESTITLLVAVFLTFVPPSGHEAGSSMRPGALCRSRERVEDPSAARSQVLTPSPLPRTFPLEEDPLLQVLHDPQHLLEALIAGGHLQGGSAPRGLGWALRENPWPSPRPRGSAGLPPRGGGSAPPQPPGSRCTGGGPGP